MVEIDLTTLRDRVGQELVVSDWVEITQQRIDQFAEATDDRQWIHVDAARALEESPFKTTIAHGFLTLSLISALLRDGLALTGVRMAINYGTNRFRFVSPVPAGSRIRGRFTLQSIEEVGGALQASWAVIVEREHNTKPCLVGEWLVRYYSR